jgi:hypothetical protein
MDFCRNGYFSNLYNEVWLAVIPLENKRAKNELSWKLKNPLTLTQRLYIHFLKKHAAKNKVRVLEKCVELKKEV